MVSDTVLIGFEGEVENPVLMYRWYEMHFYCNAFFFAQ